MSDKQLRADLELLRGEMRTEFRALRTDMASMQGKMDDGFQQCQEGLQQALEGLRHTQVAQGQIRDAMRELRVDVVTIAAIAEKTLDAIGEALARQDTEADDQTSRLEDHERRIRALEARQAS